MQELLREITELTNRIETEYPELYRHLDENPITLPRSSQPKVNTEAMKRYLDSLKQVLAHYREAHKT